MECGIVTCDVCTEQNQLYDKMYDKICDVLPDGKYIVNLEKVINLCDISFRRMILTLDERKAIYFILQNNMIASKYKQYMEAIIVFLRQHPEIEDTIIVEAEYLHIEHFIHEIKEPLEKSIIAVFDWLHRKKYITPNNTQYTRWLNYFSINTYRTHTLLCLLSICSKFHNGSSVIKNLHKEIMEYVGIEKHVSMVYSEFKREF